MPLFGSQRKQSNERRRSSNLGGENASTPTLPPPPEPQGRAPPQSMIPSRQELLFHCQLAHGSATREIKDFSNVKELYSRIADCFSIPTADIIFCTLNTHKVDMTHLLGGQIGLEDFIFAHVKGSTKEVTISKNEVALGLTITDNGAGYPFVKRIKAGSIVSRIPQICIGDLIESVDGRSMVGTRHYEVAKLLKDLPQYTDFTLRLVEPRKAFEAIAPRGSSRSGAAMVPVLDGDTSQLEAAVSKGEGRSTLRLKKDGQAVVEEVAAWETKAAEKVDDLLEAFMGIRDLELAQTMVDLGKGRGGVDEYALTMDDHLGEFEFPDDFVIDVWTAIEMQRMLSNPS